MSGRVMATRENTGDASGGGGGFKEVRCDAKGPKIGPNVSGND